LTFKKEEVKLWTEFIWLWIGPVGGFCEHGYKTLGSLKGRGLLDQLTDLDLWISLCNTQNLFKF